MKKFYVTVRVHVHPVEISFEVDAKDMASIDGDLAVDHAMDKVEHATHAEIVNVKLIEE